MVKSSDRANDEKATLLIQMYPQLYHMAEDGSWLNIAKHGLLSTAALLELFEVARSQRRALLTERRPESVRIEHSRHGVAVIRDNKPLSDEKLKRVLEGMTLKQWYSLLNRHVFFWPTLERLLRLLGARAYRDLQHIVIVVDTKSLVQHHGEDMRLSPINSGSTAYKARPRGEQTFLPLSQFPLAERKRASGTGAVAEIAVVDRVADVEDHALRVERWKGGEKVKVIWSR